MFLKFAIGSKSFGAVGLGRGRSIGKILSKLENLRNDISESLWHESLKVFRAKLDALGANNH